jgi:hypothetical protein
VEAATAGDIPHIWERVQPGDGRPLGLCPACEGLGLPTSGAAHDLRQQLTTLHACLADLLQWHDDMGGWQAPIWRAAERLRRQAPAATRGTTRPSNAIQTPMARGKKA